MRLVVVALVLGGALAASPPAPPAPRTPAAGSKLPTTDADKLLVDDEAEVEEVEEVTTRRSGVARPALLRRQGAARDLLSGGDDDSTGMAEAPEDADADALPAGRGQKSLLSQLLPLAAVLVVRLVLTALRAWSRAKGGEGAAGSPLDAINAALLSSPLGGALKAVGGAWASVVAFARSPSSAPVMMGLLIVATRLVKSMEGAQEEPAPESGEAADDDAQVEEPPEEEDDEEEEAPPPGK